MTFTVAGRAFDDGIVISHAGFLGSLWYAVDVGDESNDRLARTIACCPGGRDPSDAALDIEAVLLKNSGDVFGSLVLLESKLAEAENLIDHLLGQHSKAFDL